MSTLLILKILHAHCSKIMHPHIENFNSKNTFADPNLTMSQPCEELISYLHVSVNIMRIFFVNNSPEAIVLVTEFGQRWFEEVEIPVGNSNLCLCISSHIGHARRDDSYRGISLHAKTSAIQMKITKGEGIQEVALHVNIYNTKSLPTLYQLTKQFVREQGSEASNKTRFKQLIQDVPAQVAKEVCEEYKDLRPMTYLNGESRVYYCKCTFLWYGPGRPWAKFGPSFPLKYIERYGRRDFERFFERVREEVARNNQ